MSTPSLLLRLEALALLLAGLLAFHRLGSSWWLFAALFLAPDLSMFGFLAGPRVGSLLYNAVHTTVLPVGILLGTLLLSGPPRLLPILCIWFCHIGIDRLLGYGLKYPDAFRNTHLQHV